LTAACTESAAYYHFQHIQLAQLLYAVILTICEVVKHSVVERR